MAHAVIRKFAASGRHEGGRDIESGHEGPGVIHIDGVALIGSDTLCGHTDRTDIVWKDTTKKPTCDACLAVWDFVKNGKL